MKIQDIANQLLSGRCESQKIFIDVDGDSIPISIDIAVPCGLIINELISNSFKHAFPDKNEGKIMISIHGSKYLTEISYKDNGIGLPDKFNLDTCETFGFGVVRDLIKGQLFGKIKIEKTQGVSIQMQFDKSLYLERL